MEFKELLNQNGIADADAFVSLMKQNGIYLSKEDNIDVRYGKEKQNHETVKNQLAEANKTIEELKAGMATSEADKATIESLQNQLKEQKIENAVKMKLMESKAVDVDYLVFQLKKKGDLALDEKGEVMGLGEKLDGLKTQFPTMFYGNGSKDGDKKFDEKKLGDNEKENAITKEAFDKMGYRERLNLKNENPETYDSLVSE